MSERPEERRAPWINRICAIDTPGGCGLSPPGGRGAAGCRVLRRRTSGEPQECPATSRYRSRDREPNRLTRGGPGATVRPARSVVASDRRADRARRPVRGTQPSPAWRVSTRPLTEPVPSRSRDQRPAGPWRTLTRDDSIRDSEKRRPPGRDGRRFAGSLRQSGVRGASAAGPGGKHREPHVPVLRRARGVHREFRRPGPEHVQLEIPDPLFRGPRVWAR